MRTVLYDTGALMAAEGRDPRFSRLHQQWVRSGLHPFVPPAVLAQAWHSNGQVMLSRLLMGCRPHVLDFAGAREVGELLAATRTTDVVDAAVVVAARALRPVAVVTSDRHDIERLADAAGVGFVIIDV